MSDAVLVSAQIDHVEAEEVIVGGISNSSRCADHGST
jgi:hypothetical protein